MWSVFFGGGEDSQQLSIIRELIDKGAEVNAEDNCGNTPLHKALREDHEDCAELLKARGADLDLKNKHGFDPKLLGELMKNDIQVRFKKFFLCVCVSWVSFGQNWTFWVSWIFFFKLKY